MKLAWLIESKTEEGNAIWWTGEGWSNDAYDAIWFCRQKDAEKITSRYDFKRYIVVTEHGFY